MGRILVTGAAGFIGSNLVRELIRQGHQVDALIEKGDHGSADRLHAVDNKITVLDDFEQLMESAQACSAYDVIYHLATVGVRPGFQDIAAICDINIKMGCRLVDFAKNNRTGLLVNFGSCFEYGDHGDILLTEDLPCKPESLYAISKNAATNLITEYAKAVGASMITVRPFGVFGAGEGPGRLAPSVIRSCLKGESIRTTPGEQIRDFVNVKDLVRAIMMLTEAAYTPYEIYNICSDHPVSVKQFITEIVETCGFDLSLVQFGSIPYRTNEAMVFAGNNSKLQELIHYPFPDNHRDGILDIYNAVKNEG